MGKTTRKIADLFKRASRADIVKVFSLTSLSTLVKMLTGFVSVKVVASIIGPAGVALVGQLNNFATIAMSLSSGGINNGITKYISEFRNDEGKVRTYLSTALRITVICSLCVGVAMIVLNRLLSRLILQTEEYWYVFLIFGFTILLYAINSMLLSVVNGFKEFKKYVKINIANSIVGLCFTLAFVLTLGLPGALVSAVTYQSVMLFITMWLIRNSAWAAWSNFKGLLNKLASKQYFKYTLMTLTTAATVPISQLLLRSYVISEISPIEAGWWEAMNRLSNMYLMVITTSFTVYYMPRLSELSDKFELRREILKAYKLIVPMLIVGFTLIYLFRHLIITILFSSEFQPMENLFIWQLIGDFFKICSWLLAFLMVAKARMKAYITTEIVFALTFICLGFVFMRLNGVVGITQAYLINFILYLICMVILFKDILIIKRDKTDL